MSDAVQLHELGLGVALAHDDYPSLWVDDIFAIQAENEAHKRFTEGNTVVGKNLLDLVIAPAWRTQLRLIGWEKVATRILTVSLVIKKHSPPDVQRRIDEILDRIKTENQDAYATIDQLRKENWPDLETNATAALERMQEHPGKYAVCVFDMYSPFSRQLKLTLGDYARRESIEGNAAVAHTFIQVSLHPEDDVTRAALYLLAHVPLHTLRTYCATPQSIQALLEHDELLSIVPISGEGKATIEQIRSALRVVQIGMLDQARQLGPALGGGTSALVDTDSHAMYNSSTLMEQLKHHTHVPVRERPDVQTLERESGVQLEPQSRKQTAERPGVTHIARRGHLSLRAQADVALRIHRRGRRLVDVLQQPAPQENGHERGTEGQLTPQQRARQLAEQGVEWHWSPTDSFYTTVHALAESDAVTLSRVSLFRAVKRNEVPYHIRKGQTIFTLEDVEGVHAYEEQLREAQETPDPTSGRRRAGQKIGNRRRSTRPRRLTDVHS